MAPHSPNMFQICLTLIVLVNLRIPYIYGYSFNAFLGQRALGQQQITGIIPSKAEGPIQNQVYYNDADIVAKSTYESNPATTTANNAIFQQPQSNVYQKSPYFANVVNFQPTPFNNFPHHGGFKYNGVYYTSNSNADSNTNNAISSNQQIANAPIVTNFNNAAEANAGPNILQAFNNQNTVQQQQLNKNNNALNGQNRIANNPFPYNSQYPNQYAQNYHFHPAVNPNQIPGQGNFQGPRFFQNPNQGIFQHPGLFRNQINNYNPIQNPGIFANQHNKPVTVSPQVPSQGIFPNQINNKGIPQNQINNQEILQNPINNQILQNQISNQGIPQNPINNQGIPQNQLSNQGIPQNQLSNQGIPQNQITTQPILKYSIPSAHYQNKILENQQIQLGNDGGLQNSEQLPKQQDKESVTPQNHSQAPLATDDPIFPHPAYEPVYNNSLLQTEPEAAIQPQRISGAILGQTRETSQQNPLEPLQTLSSQEIRDAEYYSKQEPPRFPPLMDQGDIDNEQFRRTGISNGRINQPGQVQLEALVPNPDVPPRCAYNADSTATGLNGDNCIEIKK